MRQHFPSKTTKNELNHRLPLISGEDGRRGGVEIGIWLNACLPKRTRRRMDPMADKYPSLSPFAYCANNPVMLVDPDGREIWITGDGAGDAFSQLSNQVKNITLSMNSDGKIEYKGKAKTKQERLMVKAMEDKKIVILSVT